MNISNQFTQDKITTNSNESKIRYEIDNFNLIAKTYKMSLWGKEKGGNVFDFIENEIKFNVVESDFFGTGLLPRAKQHGSFLLRNRCYNI